MVRQPLAQRLQEQRLAHHGERRLEVRERRTAPIAVPPDERHLVVRAMTGDDVAGVLALERSSYDDPWGADEFLSVLAPDQPPPVGAPGGGGPRRYGVLRIDDWVGRVLSVAVDPSRRHQGVGRVLMTELARSAVAAGSHRLELEVRFKNAPA